MADKSNGEERRDLKMSLMLYVSKPARRHIAGVLGVRGTVKGRFAHRAEIAAYIQKRLDALSNLHPWWDDAPGLTPEEQEDAEHAVSHLRAAGWSDSQIRAWLNLQRARHAVLNMKGPTNGK